MIQEMIKAFFLIRRRMGQDPDPAMAFRDQVSVAYWPE